MPPESSDERLDAAVEAIVHGVYDSGALYDEHRWWPHSYLPYSPLFALEMHEQWVAQWRKVPRDGAPPYASATALWVLLAMASRSFKAMFETAERVAVFHALLDDIARAKAGDIFCGDGAHRVLTADDAQRLVDETGFVEAGDRVVDRSLAILNATLLAYSEAVFFSANCTIRDVHGPYEVSYEGRPSLLLVRDYFNLRDAALEPETEHLPFDGIRACSVYDLSVGFSFSVLNDYVSDASVVSSLRASAVEITDAGGHRPASVEEIQPANDALTATITSVSERVLGLPSGDQTLEVIRRAFYRSSPIATAAGEHWEPPAPFVAGLAERLADFEPVMPPQMTREAFATLIDPRA